MNWKLLTGIILILGARNIFFSQTNAYMAGSTKDYPVAAQLGAAVLILAGIYLVYRGKKIDPPPAA
jgi:hypothetical protein